MWDLFQTLGVFVGRNSVSIWKHLMMKSGKTLIVDSLKVPGVNKTNDSISVPKIYLKQIHPVEVEKLAT